MEIVVTPSWKDYQLLDSGNGRRLEKFGKYLLDRPDPQAIWLPRLSEQDWNNADAIFLSDSEKGKWEKRHIVPEKWLMKWQGVSFYAKLSPFKHTGVFPEQASQWEFVTEKIAASHRQVGAPRNDRVKVLNLFAYTGIASLVALSAGAEVTHVDSSKAAISWERENQEASGLTEKPIRWILEDVMKFAQRELRRGNKYDAIIMDPPIYGHGTENEVWDFMKDFSHLVESCSKLLSPNPMFVLVNAYAISASSIMLENVMRDFLPGGAFTAGELALQEKEDGRLLSTGIFCRWERS